ncbi:hypothetical protein [Rhodococcus sp. SGAir0479]|uniref:hypothetical protein n=1 Tax=Rhodococcus sp. SGAir0479 TaxID=2567884 RepID=UPI0010CD160B|nr:hypothetical protein [Rhodococcus sp. SGAir0479]QCQ93785.1 hypothetical protein E7742_05120 [Rhodococcus sp. SGAir0479]
MGQQSRAAERRWAPVKVSKVVTTRSGDIVHVDAELDGDIHPEWARAFDRMSKGRQSDLTLHHDTEPPRITLTARSDHGDSAEIVVLYAVEEVNLYVRLALELVGQ